MLRESSTAGELDVDITEVTQDAGVSNDNDIAAAGLLSDFAEAVVRRDADETARLRTRIISELGEAAFVVGTFSSNTGRLVQLLRTQPEETFASLDWAQKQGRFPRYP